MSNQYRVVCRTCEFDEIRDSLQGAQSSFSEHALADCEVVLRKVSTGDPTPVGEVNDSGTATTDSESTVD